MSLERILKRYLRRSSKRTLKRTYQNNLKTIETKPIENIKIHRNR
jgi:hypothetical protein